MKHRNVEQKEQEYIMASVIGYEEYGQDPKLYEPDLYNKTPKFCSRCGKELKTFEVTRYDPYSGAPVDLGYLRCPTLSMIHDFWRLEEYGAWVNYGER